MDKDRTGGAAAQAEGSTKQAIGKITGEAAVEADGAAQKSAGQTRKILGLAKDKSRKALDNNE